MASFDADQIRRDNPLSEYLAKRGIVLRKGGQEWTGCCPFHAEDTPSFTVYPGRNGFQQFNCFGCDAKGDVIGFVERFDSTDFKGACEILGGTRAETTGPRIASPQVERDDVYAKWVARVPPEDAPPIEAGKITPALVNPKRPDKPSPRYTPAAVYPYRLPDGRVIGYVLRVEIRGKKITPLILWCENAETGELTWCHRPFTGPRRLYNLPAFAARPEAQVLVVEGEKCAEAAQRMLPSLVATCWQGGSKAVERSDWGPVSGRDVLIWPDNDAGGVAAAQEAGRLCKQAGATRVRIIDPPGDSKKVDWDIADAEAEGWTRADVLEFARKKARLWKEKPAPVEAPPPEPTPTEPPAERPPEAVKPKPALKPLAQEKPRDEPEGIPDNVVPLRAPRRDRSSDWMQHLELDGNNNPIPKIMKNLVGFMAYHPKMEGVIAKDVFANEIVLRRPPPWIKNREDWKERVFTDADIVSAVSWLDEARMKAGVGTMTSAIVKVAEDNKFDPARIHLENLVWDGVPRLHTGPDGRSWLERYLGARPIANGIERAFGMRWLIAAVARNLTDNVDGEKVDNMLVIEGQQGMLKSTALEVLATMGGRRYFADGITDIVSKDGIMQMQGSIIVEFDELAAIAKSDTETIKSFLSRRKDKIRLPYAKSVSDMRRRFVAAGTMNPRGMGYLKDPTGARRFWPVTVTQPADIAALTADRDQLWAEAVVLYRAGEPWWLQGDEVEHAEVEQKRRFQADPWADQLNEWLNTALGDVTVAQAFRLLSIPSHLQNDAAQQRVVSHLIANGWVRKAKKVGRGKKIVFVRRETDG